MRAKRNENRLFDPATFTVNSLEKKDEGTELNHKGLATSYENPFN